MTDKFYLHPLPDTDFPARRFRRCVITAEEASVRLRDGGVLAILRIASLVEVDGELDEDVYAFHFRLSNGLETLRNQGSSYGSLLSKFPHVAEPHFFEDYYSKCFAEISMADSGLRPLDRSVEKPRRWAKQRIN